MTQHQLDTIRPLTKAERYQYGFMCTGLMVSLEQQSKDGKSWIVNEHSEKEIVKKYSKVFTDAETKDIIMICDISHNNPKCPNMWFNLWWYMQKLPAKHRFYPKNGINVYVLSYTLACQAMRVLSRN